MGYAVYEGPEGREQGYAVAAQCDSPYCSESIDRGLGYCCGGDPFPDKEEACGGFFCSAHRPSGDRCLACMAEFPPDCLDCEGSGKETSGYICEACGGTGKDGVQ